MNEYVFLAQYAVLCGIVGLALYFGYHIGRNQGRMDGAVDAYRKGLEHNDVIFKVQAAIIDRLRSRLQTEDALRAMRRSPQKQQA